MKNKIVLHRTVTGWTAQYVGPHRAEIVGLFGSDILPTAFTANAGMSEVIAEVSRLNPGVLVIAK